MIPKLFISNLRRWAIAAAALFLAAHTFGQQAAVDNTKPDADKVVEAAPPVDQAIPAPPPDTTIPPAVVNEPAAPATTDEPPPAKAQPAKKTKRAKNGNAKKFLGISKEEVQVSGSDYTLPAGQEVRSVTVMKGSATIDGDVRHDVVVTGGDLSIGGHVGGSAVAFGGELKLGPTAKIDGDLVSIGGGIRREEGAQVSGEVVDIGIQSLAEVAKAINTGEMPPWVSSWLKYCFQLGRPLSFRAGWTVALNAGFLIFYLLLLLLFPGAVRNCRTAIAQRPLNTMVLGVIGVPLIVCGMFLLGVTVVGIITWPFLIAAFTLASFIGKAAILVTFGSTLARPIRRGQGLPAAAALFIGWIVVSGVYLIPFLATAVWFGLALWGLGVALSAVFRSENRLPKQTVPTVPPAPAAATPPIPPTPPNPPQTPVVVPIASVQNLVSESNEAAVVAAASTSHGTEPAAVPLQAVTSFPMTISTEPPALKDSPKAPPSGAGFAPRRETASPIWVAAQRRPKFLKRFGALAVDALVVWALVWLIHFSNPLVLLAVLAAYQWLMVYWRSATLGSILFHQKVMRIDGRPLDGPVAGVRAVSSILSVLTFGLGWLWAQWDRDKQSWHDKLAGTVVIELDRPEPVI